ncbi:MAG: DUF933 domain-containing protein, partial [bacterium]
AVLNISESSLLSPPPSLPAYPSLPLVTISARIESELSSLAPEDRELYMKEIGLAQSGLEKLITAAYQKLGLISFFSTRSNECRAWTIKQGTKAQGAAGVIHTDFAKHFIKAKVCSVAEFLKYGGWKGVSEAGRLRLEGKDYIMQEGDVCEFMVGV